MRALTRVPAAISLALGGLALAKPAVTMKIVGLRAARPHGTPDVRATYGGLFIGAAGACLALDDPRAWRVLGAAWGGAGAARLATLTVDGAYTRENLGGVAFELAMGACILGGAGSLAHQAVS